MATYSQAGAQFGYALTWTVLLTLPFMVAIQMVSAVIGARTRRGLASSIAQRFPRSVVYGLVLLLVVANTLNIAADLAAMGASLHLVVGGAALAYSIVLGLACLGAEIVVPYHRYAGYLRILTLVLLVYVIAALTLHIPWGRVAVATFAPSIALDRDLMLTIVAVFGTTISPYLFFWQASQEAEEQRLRNPGAKRPAASRSAARSPADSARGAEETEARYRRISLDTWTGMALSNVIAFCIIATTAATLHARGITHIETAAQAAEALRPVAGELTFLLFAAGIVGTGLLAVPVLAGSAAYAVADAAGLRGSLELPARSARGFYGIIATATLGGAALAATKVNVVAMLFWAAVVNGLVAVPIMIAMMVLVSGRIGAKSFPLPAWLRALGWIATLIMAIAAVALVGSLLHSQ
ncbi:MAG TPA: divalent metal cation transporter [Steroidobacteraceae bacterium]|nr:divalent metal cation transporter [Steroidobacteraceae bacterium]